jgi:Na+-transporting NADH:ubiquinone oxidoreductase subunit NqrD
MDIVFFSVVYDSRYFNTFGFESQIYFPRGVDEVLFFLEDSAFGLRLECPNSIRGHTEMFVFTILYLVLDRYFKPFLSQLSVKLKSTFVVDFIA